MTTTPTPRRTLALRLTAAVLGALVVLVTGGVTAALATGRVAVIENRGDLTAVVIETHLPKIAIDDYVAAQARAKELAGKTVVQTWPATKTAPAQTEVINLDAGDTMGAQIPDAGYQVSLTSQYATDTASRAWGVPKATVVKAIAPLAIALLAVLVLPALRIRRRGQALALVAGAVFVLDQGSKFAAWRLVKTVAINDGGSAVMPTSGAMTALSDFYRNSLTGGFLDVISAVLLAGGLWFLWHRPRSRPVLLGGMLVWAGWASNWADRIGMTIFTAPGAKRGVVDWIGQAGHNWNLADVAIATGAILVVAAQVVHRAHLSRRTQIVGGSVLTLVAVMAAAGSMRVGPTEVVICAPVAATSISTPGIAGTVIAKVTLTTGGATCLGGIATPVLDVVTALDASGVVLGSGQADKLETIWTSGTYLRLLPLEGSTLLVADGSNAFTGGTWTPVAAGKWLLVGGDSTKLAATVRSFLAPATAA